MMKKNVNDDLLYVFILDLDDTLYQEVDFVCSAFKHIDRMLVADYGYQAGKAFGVLMGAALSGNNAFDALNSRLVKDGVEVPNAIDWMVDEYRYHIPHITLSADAQHFLQELDKYDIDRYIITDGRSVTQRNKIRALGLDFFVPPENVFISEEVGCDKTNPKAFMDILERYDSVKRMCKVQFIFVGDNPAKDFFVGNTFGYPTVMLVDKGNNIHNQTMPSLPHYAPKMMVSRLIDIVKLLKHGAFEP